MIKQILFSSLFFLSLSAITFFALLVPQAVQAQCPNFEEWTEYRCASVDTCRAESPGQNNNVLSRNCWIPGIEETYTTEACSTDSATGQKTCRNIKHTTCVRGGKRCATEKVSRDCGISRVCSGQTGWTKIAAPPTDWCACAGKCYIPPSPKPLNDASLSPKNVFGEDGKVKLPINIGWDEAAEQQIVSKDACAIGAYRYRIAGQAGNSVFEKSVVNPRTSCDLTSADQDQSKTCGSVFAQAYKNEDGGMMNKAHAIADKNRGYVSTPDGKDSVEKGIVSPTYNYLSGRYDYALTPEADNLQTLVRNPERFCILTPGQAYALSIKSCIDQAGSDCGKESAPFSFSTYQAPELIFPFDRDFEGSANVDPEIPTVLQWCKDPLAESYSINLTRKTTPAELKETGLNEIQIPLDNITKDQTSYVDEAALREIKNRVLYYWQIVSCAMRNGQQCSRPSQQWSIFAQDALGVPETLASDPVVNTESVLTWYESFYTPLYFVHIKGEGRDVYKTTTTRSLAIDTVWNSLQTNTQYSWRVTACPLEATNPSQCNKDKSGQIGWSAFASFTTTGAPPTVELDPSKNGTATLPLDIRWNRIPGALSYAYTLKGEQDVKGFTADVALNAALASSSDPGTFRLNADKTYTLAVASCASKNGTRCGTPATRQFTVKPPQKPEPISPAPSATVSLPDVRLEWKPVFSGNIYQRSITYLSPAADEKNTSCLGQVGREVSSAIVTEPRAQDRLACAGQYEARIAPCMDSACSAKGEEAVWTFSATVATQRSAFAGLVPCGRSERSVPAPPWNELESCEFRHVFLLGKILLDFLLYNAAPTLVVLFSLYTGAIAYFSLGSPDTLSRIKGIWRAIGIGLLIMFFSWMFMNLLLGILGFNVSIFGRWYEVRIQ